MDPTLGTLFSYYESATSAGNGKAVGIGIGVTFAIVVVIIAAFVALRLFYPPCKNMNAMKRMIFETDDRD